MPSFTRPTPPATRRRAAFSFLLAVAAACGGTERPESNATTTTRGAGNASLDTTPTTAKRADSCDTSVDEILGTMNDATFAVVGEAQVRQQDGTSKPTYFLIGTAWAVRDQLMATNAHVTEAYRVFAEQGIQLTGALAVQSRTGSVVRLLQGMTHPDYTGDPLGSPDIGLFTTREILPVTLPVSSDPDVRLGDEIMIVGFPGDVNEFIQIIPGQTVPQATSLRGQVTALRSHDLTKVVTSENLDVVQHQAPTTPGTSGSAMVACDEVVAVNNAGTVQFVVTPGPNGEFKIDRAAAAANNFAVHARHLGDLLALLDAGKLQSFALPIPAKQAPPPTSTTPSTPTTQAGEPAVIGTWFGRVVPGPAEHSFAFAIDAQGNITGLSEWAETGQFELTGRIANDGFFRITDNAPERLGFRRGVYEGRMDANGNAAGSYFEETQEAQRFDFQVQRTR